MLLELAGNSGAGREIAKQCGHPVPDCNAMLAMLREQAVLGKPEVVMENGVKVTKCPPGYARGFYPARTVGMKRGGS